MSVRHKIGWTLSRYWNHVIFAALRVLPKMIWDYTERNHDLIKDIRRPIHYAQPLLTYRKWIRD